MQVILRHHAAKSIACTCFKFEFIKLFFFVFETDNNMKDNFDLVKKALIEKETGKGYLAQERLKQLAKEEAMLEAMKASDQRRLMDQIYKL